MAMAWKGCQVDKPEEMPCKRMWRLGNFSRSSKMGQPPQYYHKIKAWYRDPLILHIATRYGGVNSSIRKQNGRGPHLQKREISELDQRAKKCRLQSSCNARWGWCQSIHRIISLQSPNQTLNMWQKKNKSSEIFGWSSRKQFLVVLEQK